MINDPIAFGLLLIIFTMICLMELSRYDRSAVDVLRRQFEVSEINVMETQTTVGCEAT